MDIQPPQWGSARTARTAPRIVGAPPRALKSIISYRIAHFARSPLARCHPDLQSCHISHTTRTAPRTVGAPPGALKSIIFYRIARFACHFWRAVTLTFSLARSRTKSRTGKIVRDHGPVRARFVVPPYNSVVPPQNLVVPPCNLAVPPYDLVVPPYDLVVPLYEPGRSSL